MGHPDDGYALEPMPNGHRINIGAFGNTYQAATIDDADFDVLPDSWELAYGLNPAIANLLNDDDSDLVSDYHEYFAGTDPSNNGSTPSLSGLDTDSDGFDDSIDNCPFLYNPTQMDMNGNGVGDECNSSFDVPMLNIAWMFTLSIVLAIIGRRSFNQT